jgi:hypothetical protein
MVVFVVAVIEGALIERAFVILDLIQQTLGIGLGRKVFIEEFVIKQVIVFGFVEVVFVAHTRLLE